MKNGNIDNNTCESWTNIADDLWDEGDDDVTGDSSAGGDENNRDSHDNIGNYNGNNDDKSSSDGSRNTDNYTDDSELWDSSENTSSHWFISADTGMNGGVSI